MTYYVIMRGPLGVGKSTVCDELARRVGGAHISIDKILSDHKLGKHKAEDGFISEESFLRANELAIPVIREHLTKGEPVFIDGNFYRKNQIEDLIEKVDAPHYVFTLHAPLEACIARDVERGETHGAIAAQVVYKVTMSFDYGTVIETEGKTKDQVVEEVLSCIK